ncbi:MAG: TonB-dependent receptor, partial [Sediminibacterium sp.]
IEAEQALENALYISDKYTISEPFSIEAGVRYSFFSYLGARTINTYLPGVPLTESTQTGSTKYNSGAFIKTYHAPEFRIAARYVFMNDMSIKASINTQRQYIQVLSNTTAIAPTDIWKLSDPNIKPQSGIQYSLGLYKNFNQGMYETSLEVYYKRMSGFLDYKSGATLVLNKHIETDVVSTKGKAYGVELLLKKTTGKLNGWISYSYSRTLLQMNDSSLGDPVNKGAFYPANYDKPHDVTIAANYRISHRYSFSWNATYSTGRPITLPIGRFDYAGGGRTLYADRNGHRIPDYFRMDFAITLDGNHKVNQTFHNSFTFGAYNLTGQKNPYSVYYISERGAINGYKLSIFGSIIPYLNYNIRF